MVTKDRAILSVQSFDPAKDFITVHHLGGFLASRQNFFIKLLTEKHTSWSATKRNMLLMYLFFTVIAYACDLTCRPE